MTFFEAMTRVKTNGKIALSEGNEVKSLACVAVYNTILEFVEQYPELLHEEFEVDS